MTIYSLDVFLSQLKPCRSMFDTNCCFLTCIQISQEAGEVVWYPRILKNLLQLAVNHTVKGFGIVNKAEADVFLEQSLSHVQLFVTPWTAAHQTPLSKGFSKLEYQSGLPFPSPGDFPNSRTEPVSLVPPALQADSLPSEPLRKSAKFCQPGSMKFS